MNNSIERQAEDIVRAMVSQSWNEEIETVAAVLAENERLQAELAEAQAAAGAWKAQANRSGISYAECFAEKQDCATKLSVALNENARLKDENEALKVGEAGELLAKAQEEAKGWKEFVDRISESFRKYREEVESQELYKVQRRVIFSLIDERNKLIAELDAARKVADAAIDWVDAFPGYEAGASGSSEYLRAREVLLRATVREYRARPLSPEKRAVINRALDKTDEEWEALAAMEVKTNV